MFPNSSLLVPHIQVHAPKVQGLLRTSLATSSSPVQSLVAFSSTSALMGSTGQANYAAANAALSAWAGNRHTMGGAAVSVQWGAWGLGGMATDDAATLRRMGVNLGSHV